MEAAVGSLSDPPLVPLEKRQRRRSGFLFFTPTQGVRQHSEDKISQVSQVDICAFSKLVVLVPRSLCQIVLLQVRKGVRKETPTAPFSKIAPIRVVLAIKLVTPPPLCLHSKRPL